MPEVPVSPLSLPEAWALLSLTASGKVRDRRQAQVGCAAAELGELALRGKLLVRPRKFRASGFDVYRTTSPAEIELLDTGHTGLWWADELLSDLERRRAGEQGPLSLRPWLRERRSEALVRHLDALAERNVLRHAPGARSTAFRLFKPERYYPEPAVRGALVAGLRAAGTGQHPLDERTMFLFDLVVTSELRRDLGFKVAMSQRLDRGRGAGTVEDVPENLRDTSAALAVSVPKRSRHQD